MTRPSRAQVLMKNALDWADRSTCGRLAVGCVFSRDGRILVQGYNGAPAGLPHCDHSCDCFTTELFADAYTEPITILHEEECNSKRPCQEAVHAEQNGIAWAARHGVGLEGSSLSVTHQPCLNCAMSIINAGIQEVTYLNAYRLQDGVHLLTRAGVDVYRMIDIDSGIREMV